MTAGSQLERSESEWFCDCLHVISVIFL